MGLSEEDNRAWSTAGPAPHNHSHYWDTETLQQENEGTRSVTVCTINIWRGGAGTLLFRLEAS